MKSLFSEYSFIILSAIVVTLLVALASPVGASVKDSVTGLIIKFSGTSESLSGSMETTITETNLNMLGEATMYAVPEAKLPSGSIQGLNATLDGTSPASFYSLEPMADLQEVRVDGSIVEPINYDVTSGSTIITLHDDFIASLEDGEHTIDIVSKNAKTRGIFTREINIENEIWVLNVEFNYPCDQLEFNIPFIANGENYSKITVNYYGRPSTWGLWFNDNYICEPGSPFFWCRGNEYRTIEFLETPSDDLLDWLSANAVKQ